MSGPSTGAKEGSPSPPSRITRSSIKPRLLFPPAQSSTISSSLEDEEADTDVEDNRHAISDARTPENLVDSAPATPRAPRLAATDAVTTTSAAPMATPPTTARTKRTGVKPADEPSPVKTAHHASAAVSTVRRSSPFDGWRRTKSVSVDAGKSTTHGVKRQAAEASATQTAAKKSKA